MEIINFKNVLITSASSKVPLVLAFKQAVNKLSSRIKVFAGDISSDILAKYVADDFWLMPQTCDANVDAILDFCLKNEIGCILPTRDAELNFWSRQKALFQTYEINVVISRTETIDLCLDKLLFFEFCESRMQGVIPTSVDIASIDSNTFVVKERNGAGSKSIGVNLRKKDALSHAKKLDNPIYQPFVDGEEISIDAWISANHSVKGLVLRKRLLVLDGEAKVTSTFRDISIEKYFKDFCEQFEFYGPIVLQAIIDNNGKIHVIECNPRFGGASTASISVGLNSLVWSYADGQMGLDANSIFNRSESEIMQIRLPGDHIEHVPYNI